MHDVDYRTLSGNSSGIFLKWYTDEASPQVRPQGSQEFDIFNLTGLTTSQWRFALAAKAYKKQTRTTNYDAVRAEKLSSRTSDIRVVHRAELVDEASRQFAEHKPGQVLLEHKLRISQATRAHENHGPPTEQPACKTPKTALTRVAGAKHAGYETAA